MENNSYLIDDVVTIILSFLEFNDLVRVALVNKTWNNLANNDLLWQTLFERDFPWASESNIKVFGSWKRAYEHKFLLEKNPNESWCWPITKKHILLFKVEKKTPFHQVIKEYIETIIERIRTLCK